MAQSQQPQQPQPPRQPATPRTILHLDIDSFLAAVEQVHDPALQGRPVAVGSGVVASCSIEAKRAGVRSAMAMSEARRRCPRLLVLPGDSARAAAYRDRIEAIIRRHTPVVERASLDDFYADLTGIPEPPPTAAARIRQSAKDEVGLSVAQGLGSTRTVARLATDRVKPGGILALQAARELDFLAAHPVERLPGVGRRTLVLFTRLGLRRVAHLRQLGLESLQGLLGRRGERIWRQAWARDLEPVLDDLGPERRKRRQVSRETSFHQPTADPDLVTGLLAWLLDRALATLRSEGLRARRLEVQLRYADNIYAALGQPLQPAADTFAAAAPVARECLRRVWSRRLLLRGLGVRLSRFGVETGVQDGLWDRDPGRRERLEDALGRIRGKHGFGRVLRGPETLLLGRLPEGPEGFRLRTPSLSL